MTSTQIERAEALRKKNNARRNILAVIIFTMINLVLLALDTGTMFLFSASVPYYVAVLGAAFGIPELLYICLAIAGVGLLFYFLCWYFSKNRGGWMATALVLFALDTVVLIILSILAEDFSSIMDVLLHAYILYTLVLGAMADRTLKRLPEEPVSGEEPPEEP